jgi:propionyl-CoA carboxylase beta chain
MRKVIQEIVDGGDFLEVMEKFAPNILIGFVRLDGKATGVIANQPLVYAGCLDIQASVKAARFIRFCDAFNIPILNLADCPGYLPGTQQEYGGIIRHGAKMLFAYCEATVPRVSVIVRKIYGGAMSGMAVSNGGDDLTVSPTAEIAIMDPRLTTSFSRRDCGGKSAEMCGRRFWNTGKFANLCGCGRGDGSTPSSKGPASFLIRFEQLRTNNEIRPP